MAIERNEQSMLAEIDMLFKSITPDVFKSSPEFFHGACTSIIKDYFSNPTRNPLSIEYFSKICQVEPDLETMLPVLNYLCGYIDVLTMRFKFKHEGFEYILDEMEVLELFHNDIFLHPITKQKVDDCKKHIFPFWVYNH